MSCRPVKVGDCRKAFDVVDHQIIAFHHKVCRSYYDLSKNSTKKNDNNMSSPRHSATVYFLCLKLLLKFNASHSNYLMLFFLSSRLDSPEAGIHCFEKLSDWKSRSASLSCVPTCDTLVDIDYDTPYGTRNTPYAPTVRDDSAIMLNERTRESRRCSNTPTRNTCSVSSDSKLDWTDDISFR